MAARTIETKAIISAEDKTGNAFSAVVQKMAKMESAARQANITLGSVDRAAATTRRAQLAHDRERLKIQREIDHHGTARYVAQGAASAFAAHSIVEKITESIKAGAELQHSLTALKNSGRSIEEIAEIMKRAGDVMKTVPTSSIKENLDTVLETTGAFGSLHHALENLEFVQKVTSVLKAAGDGEATSKSVAYDTIKFAEIRGSAGDTQRLQSETNEMARGMVFTGGKFNPHEAFEFATQTQSLLSKYSLHFLSRILPSLSTEVGGKVIGSRANAFANVILGKARDKKQTEEWVRLGLLDPNEVINSKQGPTGWKAGAVSNTNLALSDPDVWAEKVLIPAMKAHGVDPNDSFAVTKELNQLLRNQESNRFATAIVDALQRARLHKDDKNIDGAGTINDIYKRLLDEDPIVAMEALTSSVQSLMAVISLPAMKTAAAGLSGLATGIQTLASSLKDHPLLALTGGATVAGGALYGAGRLAYSAANGFGLSTSAGMLEHSALMLDTAAMKLSVGSEASAAEGLLGNAGKLETSFLALSLRAAGLVGVLATFDTALIGLLGWYKDAHPNEFKTKGRGANVEPKPDPVMNFVRAPRRGSNGYWIPAATSGDFTLNSGSTFALKADSSNGFTKIIGADGKPTLVNSGFRPGPANSASSSNSLTARNPHPDVMVDFTQPPPIAIKVEITASSALLDIARQAKDAEVQLKAQARGRDTGPGGLGETHTGQ